MTEIECGDSLLIATMKDDLQVELRKEMWKKWPTLPARGSKVADGQMKEIFGRCPPYIVADPCRAYVGVHVAVPFSALLPRQTRKFGDGSWPTRQAKRDMGALSHDLG